MIITIDGPAGSGKSTVADILANNLGFIHFNSGSLYRGLTAYLYKNNFDFEELKTNNPVPNMKIEVKMINNFQHVYVNGEDFTPLLRENIVSQLVPFVAANIHARKLVDDCQKEFCKKNNVVMEGRDLGTFVFPNAEFKFYLDCSIKERARRRFLEEKAKNSTITLEEIEEQIAERDHLDKTREIAPLRVPQNAIIIDSTHLSINEVADEMMNNLSLHIKF